MKPSTLRALLLAFFLLLPCITSSRLYPSLRRLTQDCQIEVIYSFGDSIADTGNLLIEGVHGGSFSGIAKLPYGETTFDEPTGRCSNGLLMIDYITQDLGLPFLNPYLAKQANFDNGVNFAVAGATALDQSKQGGGLPPFTNSSLGVQLGWFKDYLKTLCSSQEECAEKIRNAIFFVDEIGGNDYNYAFFAGQPIEQVQKMIPSVVEKIISVARELLDMGATKLVIPGNFPIGCMPGYLTLVNSSNPSDYDETNCLANLNVFAKEHNSRLQDATQNLQASYPDDVILYSDYYSAMKSILSNADSFGFALSSLTKACCGGGDGQFNYDSHKLCGSKGSTVCTDPSRYVSWDGIHLTQHVYQLMVRELLDDFTYPSGGVQAIQQC